MSDPVVITGMGAITSLGASLDETWTALLGGNRGIGPIRRFDPTGFATGYAALAPAIDTEALSPGLRASIAGYETSLLLASSKAAMRGAQLEATEIARDEIGFFAGLGAIDYNVDDLLPAVRDARTRDGGLDYAAFFSEHYRKIHPLYLLSMLNNVAFCQVAIALDIRGENCVLSPAGDAGAHAIAEARNAVREGRARVALAGGVSEEVTPLALARYLFLNLLSQENQGACRPFAADRRGTVLGEGGGVLVLERRSSAVERNVSPLAEISGIGEACEIEGAGPAPTSRAIWKAMELALAEAHLGPEAIDLIIANGDGSPEGDRAEMLAIEELFGGSPDAVGVVSLKGSIGHLLAGAPLVDAALGVLMLRHGVVPGMGAGLKRDPACRLNLLIGGPTTRPLERVMINAQGFAGQCVSIVVAAPDRAA